MHRENMDAKYITMHNTNVSKISYSSTVRQYLLEIMLLFIIRKEVITKFVTRTLLFE